MNQFRNMVQRALAHRSDLNRMGLGAVELEDLTDEVLASVLHSADVAVVDPVPDRDDAAALVYAGGFVTEAWPLAPLAANGCPTVPVWTSLYDPAARAHLVVFDLEDLPWWKRSLIRHLERGTDPARDW